MEGASSFQLRSGTPLSAESRPVGSAALPAESAGRSIKGKTLTQFVLEQSEDVVVLWTDGSDFQVVGDCLRRLRVELVGKGLSMVSAVVGMSAQAAATVA